MLCIGRQWGEWVQVQVGDVTFRLCVQRRTRGQDPVGVIFDAPPEVKILREELLRKARGGKPA